MITVVTILIITVLFCDDPQNPFGIPSGHASCHGSVGGRWKTRGDLFEWQQGGWDPWENAGTAGRGST